MYLQTSAPYHQLNKKPFSPNFTLSLLNARSIQATNRQEQLQSLLSLHQIDVAVITETWLTRSPTPSPDYTYVTTKSSPSQGIAIILRKSKFSSYQQLQPAFANEYLLCIKANFNKATGLNKRSIIIIGAYAQPFYQKRKMLYLLSTSSHKTLSSLSQMTSLS